MNRGLGVWVTLLVAGAGCLAVPAQGELSVQALTVRSWDVDWDVGGQDLGREPLWMGGYMVSYDEWYLSFLGGWGDGWAADSSDADLRNMGIDPSEVAGVSRRSEVERMDLQWVTGKQFYVRDGDLDLGPFLLGLSYHYVEWKTDGIGARAIPGVRPGEVYYHGPELVFGWTEDLVDGLYVRSSATYMPYLWWTVDDGGLAFGSEDGTTWGYQYDVGLMVQFQNIPLLAAGGYRALTVEEDGAQFQEDDFAGGYAELGFTW